LTPRLSRVRKWTKKQPRPKSRKVATRIVLGGIVTTRRESVSDLT
jgi:hypothetical protein